MAGTIIATDTMPETDNMPETFFVDSAAGKVAYQEMGVGETLIMIHGGGPGAYGYSNYRRNMAALAEGGYRVVVMDMPGYGQSDHRPPVGGLFAAPSQAVVELIEHLGVGKASLVGNSLGGGTALRVAIDHPELVDKLILLGPGGSLPATSTFPSEGLIRMLMFYEGEGPTVEKLNRVIDLLVYDRSTITPELVEERFRTATLPQTLANPPLKGATVDPRNELWREPLDKVTHRTLMIWGREDKVLPLDMAFIYLKRLPNADLHIFSKCGHWAQWERADEFNELVLTFLDRKHDA